MAVAALGAAALGRVLGKRSSNQLNAARHGGSLGGRPQLTDEVTAAGPYYRGPISNYLQVGGTPAITGNSDLFSAAQQSRPFANPFGDDVEIPNQTPLVRVLIKSNFMPWDPEGDQTFCSGWRNKVLLMASSINSDAQVIFNMFGPTTQYPYTTIDMTNTMVSFSINVRYNSTPTGIVRLRNGWPLLMINQMTIVNGQTKSVQTKYDQKCGVMLHQRLRAGDHQKLLSNTYSTFDEGLVGFSRRWQTLNVAPVANEWQDWVYSMVAATAGGLVPSNTTENQIFAPGADAATTLRVTRLQCFVPLQYLLPHAQFATYLSATMNTVITMNLTSDATDALFYANAVDAGSISLTYDTSRTFILLDAYQTGPAANNAYLGQANSSGVVYTSNEYRVSWSMTGFTVGSNTFQDQTQYNNFSQLSYGVTAKYLPQDSTPQKAATRWELDAGIVNDLAGTPTNWLAYQLTRDNWTQTFATKLSVDYSGDSSQFTQFSQARRMMFMFRQTLMNQYNVSSGLPYQIPMAVWHWMNPAFAGQIPGGSVIEVPLTPAGYLRTTETGVQDVITMMLEMRCDHPLGPNVINMQFLFLWRNRTSTMLKDNVVALSDWPNLTNVNDVALSTNPYPTLTQQLLAAQG